MSEVGSLLLVFFIGVAASVIGVMVGGGYVGAHIAIKSGDVWVRRLFALVVLASAMRLLCS